VRVILELAGIENVLTKIIYSKNPYSVARATIDGLKRLRTKEQVTLLRQGA
jgi:small subunit ribosomal protein S5